MPQRLTSLAVYSGEQNSIKCHLRRCLFSAIVLLAACSDRPWNNPYPVAEDRQNVMYSYFSERPKHLDPVRSYSANEYEFLAQIYEPPLQYHYLERPYRLVPATAVEVPKPLYLDSQGQALDPDGDPERIAFSVYDIAIQPGVRYQPHPAFARDATGAFLYHHMTEDELASIHQLRDFPEVGTRELTAADYVYQIKRLAHPQLHSPIFGIMSEYIVGLKEYEARLNDVLKQRGDDPEFLDLDQYPLEGVESVDRYRYRIKVKGKYPQLVYWLAMPFFAPMPSEADRFYAQTGLVERNITLDWYPVGTGPYMLTVNNPNRQMVLERNPNFRTEFYPDSGEPSDFSGGLMVDAGKKLPFIDKVVYSLEKETIPYWNKFLQGYYDTSGISSDSFDQAIRIGGQGEATLSDEMREKGIRLLTAVAPSVYYMGFNMLDPVVGGYSDRQRKLRQAISIAIDQEEYISIFLNGRGIAAQSPLPPGIFGYRGDINAVVYEDVAGRVQRRSLAQARKLLDEAGYANGIDRDTGKPVVIHLDITATGPDDKARLDWYRKQFQKLDIQLVIRNTDYNRFQEKMRAGNNQIFLWGWNADYPDPENFLFLLYGPNGKVEFKGENAANYANSDFDRLFEAMKNMDNGPERQRVISEMVNILRRDAPWVWGLHPKSYALYHGWYRNAKPNLIANNTLKYKRIDAELRALKRAEWNRPQLWPIVLFGSALLLTIVPAVSVYLRREHRGPATRQMPASGASP